MISERTTAALSFKRAHGQVYNHVPFGFNAEDGALVRSTAEQAVIARMATLRAEGMSYRRIADVLNNDGVRGKQGGVWGQQTVKNVLTAA
jgi:hypothetical protein